MTYHHRMVQPDPSRGILLSESDEPLTPPDDWAFLPAGDAAITKSVKAKGETWVVMVRKGRRLISKGIWAKTEHIMASQKEIQAKRSTPEYAKQRNKDLERRKAKETAYAREFFTEVVSFLNFHHRYQTEAKLLGEKITEHATPVGSNTVARTQRIPIAKRAEAAVIAWMRHHTTAYDSMRIARKKGQRRSVRRQLAAKSLEVLQAYRHGQAVDDNCPLKKALG